MSFQTQNPKNPLMYVKGNGNKQNYPLRLFKPKFFSCKMNEKKEIVFLGNNPCVLYVHKYIGANDKFPTYNPCYGHYENLGKDVDGNKILNERGHNYEWIPGECCNVIGKRHQRMQFYPVVVLDDSYIDSKTQEKKSIQNELQLIPLHEDQLKMIEALLETLNEKEKKRSKNNVDFTGFKMTDRIWTVFRSGEKDRVSGGSFSTDKDDVINIDNMIGDITFNRMLLTKILADASSSKESEEVFWNMFDPGLSEKDEDTNFVINSDHNGNREISVKTLRNLKFNYVTIFPYEPDRISEYMSNPVFLADLEKNRNRYGGGNDDQHKQTDNAQRATQVVQNFQPQYTQNQPVQRQQPMQQTQQRSVTSQRPQVQQQPARNNPMPQRQQFNQQLPPAANFQNYPQVDDDIPF